MPNHATKWKWYRRAEKKKEKHKKSHSMPKCQCVHDIHRATCTFINQKAIERKAAQKSKCHKLATIQRFDISILLRGIRFGRAILLVPLLLLVPLVLHPIHTFYVELEVPINRPQHSGTPGTPMNAICVHFEYVRLSECVCVCARYSTTRVYVTNCVQ